MTSAATGTAAETAGPRASVPAALTPPPGNPRFPLMDSLRALAALSVVVYHVGFFGHSQQTHSYGAALTSLGFGVAIFFVLSGFLLYRPLFNSELTGAPRPSLRDYARRRLLRIVPAYWLALTALAIFPGLVGVFTDHWWRYYAFLQIYDSRGLIRLTGIIVAWSLCIEVTFYLALPLYAAAMGRLSRGLGRGGRVRLQLAFLIVLAALSIVVGWIPGGNATRESLLTFFDWFAYGMALAVVSVALRGATRQHRPVRLVVEHPALCWGAALGVYAVLTGLVAHAPQHFMFSNSQAVEDHVLRGLLSFLIVLPAVFGGGAGGWPRRVLSWRWLQWLGEISYGIYLWHLPLLLWLYREGVHFPPALLAATLAWTIACASASYYLVERPLLRFKDRGPRLRPPQRTGRPIAVTGSPSGAVPAGRR